MNLPKLITDLRSTRISIETKARAGETPSDDDFEKLERIEQLLVELHESAVSTYTAIVVGLSARDRSIPTVVHTLTVSLELVNGSTIEIPMPRSAAPAIGQSVALTMFGEPGSAL